MKNAGEATISPDGYRIAFANHPDTVIGTSGLDGLNRDAFPDAKGQSPIWSPTGDRIAFVHLEPNQKRFFFFTQKPSGIYTMAPDGSDLRRIATISIPEDQNVKYKIYNGSLTWSPDGESLFFLNYEQNTIYKVKADGSDLDAWFVHPTSESEARYPIRSPLSWSPDGELMAFVTVPSEGILRLHTVGKDGSVVRELALTDSHWDEVRFGRMIVSSLKWSPSEGKVLIAFRPRIPVESIWNSDNELYDQRLYVVDVWNSQVNQIGQGAAASWSPDGTRIAVVRALWGGDLINLVRTPGWHENNTALLTMDPDGSDINILARYDWKGHLILEERLNEGR